MSELPRVAKIVLPILRGHNDLQNKSSVRFPGATIGTWTEDIDYRTFPLVNIRRMGGPRNPKRPMSLGNPIIEMTVYAKGSAPDTEQFYEDVLEALYEAVQLQTVTPWGYLHSMRETMGTTTFQSPFADSWRVQGLIMLGIRPSRNTP